MNKDSNTPKKSNGGIKEIREIIFGDFLNNLQAQINELKSENKELKDKLKIKDQEVDKAFTQIDKLKEDLKEDLKEANREHSNLLKQVESNNKNLSDKISDLESTKIDKNQIGQAFIEWGTSVKQQPNS